MSVTTKLYELILMEDAIQLVTILDFKIIKKETLIILEYAKRKKLNIPKDFKVIKKKDYGNSSLKLIKLK